MENKTPKVFICIRLRPKINDKSKAIAEFMENIKRARIAARYAVLNGYDPEATTIYFTQFLDDSMIKERELGMKIGQSRLISCDKLRVVLDLDEGEMPSSEMSSDMATALENGIPIEYKDLSKIKTWVENYNKTSK